MTPGEPRTAAGQALLHHIRKSDQGYPAPGTTIPELIRTIEDEARAGSLDAASLAQALHDEFWDSTTPHTMESCGLEVGSVRRVLAALREAQPYVHDAPCPLSGTPHTHEVRRL